MFDAKMNEKGEVLLSGRFDASQVDTAKKVFAEINQSTIVNFTDLEYISSAGLGVLLMTQKRLMGSRQRLKLTGMNQHIKEIFKYAGFDNVFEIE